MTESTGPTDDCAKRMNDLQKALPLPPSLRYGATSKFMNGLSYTTIIEFAEPLARLSRRSRAKTDRRGSALDREAKETQL